MSKNILQLLKVNYTLLFSVQSSHNKPTCVAFISINTIEQQRFFLSQEKGRHLFPALYACTAFMDP